MTPNHMPNRFIRAVLALALMPVAVSTSAQTAPPNSINFQGRLATQNGNPVPDGTYNLRLRLYDAATGGTMLYDQSLTNIPVKNGTFAVKIDGFTADKFNGNTWLGISINGTADLAPRTQIVSVPYALKSNLAVTVADNSITTTNLQANAVTTAKIADAGITNAKLAGNITADKFAANIFNPVAWLLSGNSGVTGGFLGTVDNQPLVFKTNNAERIRITAGGFVGIGTAAPKMPIHNSGGYYGQGDIRLHSYDGDGVDGTAFVQARDDSTTSNLGMTLRTKAGSTLYDAIKIAPLGRIAISTIFTEARLAVEPNGLQFAIGTNGSIIAGNYLNSSDARLKHHIETVPDALSAVLALRGVSYNWNPSVKNGITGQKERQYGFLAQEVEAVLPALVQPGLNGYKAVNYMGIIPVTVEAIKALNARTVLQQKQMESLKKDNELKQSQIDALTRRLDVLEAQNARR